MAYSFSVLMRDPITGVRKKKGVSLHSGQPIPIDLLRSVLDSIAPKKLTKTPFELKLMSNPYSTLTINIPVSLWLDG